MSDVHELLTGLDPEQRAVATHLDGPLVVLAGAGTGKTRAITHRIAYGVATGAYDPRQVLAVTFTTRAAGEMRHRLGTLGAPRVQARTFHSAALAQARYFWPKVHRGDLPPLLQNRTALIADAARRLRLGSDRAMLRDLSGEITWAKVSNLTPERYTAQAAANGRTAGNLDPSAVAKVFEGYEELKRERERIDFEDILLCAASLLADHPEIAAQFHRTYRWLVVDEYQDVSPLQQALLSLWSGDRDDVCVVGDPAQTIHSFAGARADYLTGFASRHPGATTIELVRNYRSTPQVIALANQVMHRARGDHAPTSSVTLQPQREAGVEVVHVDHPDEGAEARGVAEWLLARHEEGVAWREMAVLFRVNSQSPSYEAALSDHQVPYLIRGAERFYDRPEVRQGLLLIRAEARNDPDAAPLERVKVLLGSVGWTPEPPAGAGAVRERWESLAALVQVVADLVAATPSITVVQVSNELGARAESHHVPTADAVTLTTLHSAKGLEWDAVALVGIQEGTVPFVLATGPEQVAEERRLLYVGITRARSHLRLSWSRSRSGGEGRRRSRFLDGVLPDGSTSTGGARSRTVSRTTATPRRTVQVRHCRSCGQVLHTGAEYKLGRHQDCPATYDEALLEELRQWRTEEAGRSKLPAFTILTDATLTALAEACPSDATQLLRINGLGKVKVDRYGAAVLEIITARTAGKNSSGK